MVGEWFTESEHRTSDFGFEFVPKVLSMVNWKFTKEQEFNKPAGMKNCMDNFTSTYKRQYKMRNLEYQFELGEMEVGITNSKDGKNYTLVCNTTQYAILELFNHEEVITYSDIEKRLGYEKQKPIQQAMKQLCNPKIGVLQKETKKPVFTADEKIKMNMKYSNKKIRLDVQPARERAAPAAVIDDKMK